MADLPDYYTQTAISEAEAASFKGGLDANKSDTPVSRDIYYATDSKILRVCVVDGTWININALYLLLAGGTMTGAIAMGANKITGLADPAAAQDAATRAYVLAQKALCLLLTGGTMSGNIAMGTKKVTNLGAPTVAGDALRKGTRVTVSELPAMTDERIWKGTGVDVEEVDLPTEGVGLESTVARFQANAATGDFAVSPEHINNNNTALDARADTIDQYAEVDFGIVVSIRRYRQYGHAAATGDGVWKIQYYNLATHAWADWATGIALRATADWSDLVTVSEVLTDKIRLVCTTVDTGIVDSAIGELEVIY